MANGIKRGVTDFTSLKRGVSSVSKIFRGASLIWENWILMSGNLALMTSNSTPAPFSCSTTIGGNAYQSFDQTDFNGVSTNSSAITYQLNFGQLIKVLEFDGLFRTAGGSNYTLTVDLLKDGTTWTQVYSTTWNDPFNMNVVLSGGNIFESTAIRINVPYTNGGVMRYMAMFKIRKWYQKG